MKKLLVIGLLLASTNLLAATAKTSEDVDSSVSAQAETEVTHYKDVIRGLRVAISQSSSQFEISKKSPDGSASYNRNLDGKDSPSISVGYSRVMVGQIGVVASLAYASFKPDNIDVQVLRGEGNLSYGFTDKFYGLAGMSYEYFLSGLNDVIGAQALDSLKMGYGIQVGAGYQFTKHIGLEATTAYTLHYGVAEEKPTEARTALEEFTADDSRTVTIGRTSMQISLTGNF